MNQTRSDSPGPTGPGDGARVCTKSDVAAQYDHFHTNLHQVASKVFDGRRPDAADDAVMFVFSRLLELVAEQKLTDKGEMWGPYLRRAVHNKCIDLLRNEKRERERFPKGDPNDQRIIDWDPLGDVVASNLEQSRRLARLPDAVASLSDRHAAIIKHKFWDLWPDNKIGETLCISGQAVGQQLRTALKKLNQEVNRDD